MSKLSDAVAPQLLKPKAAGARLGVSDDTIRRMVAAGELAGTDIGSERYPRLRISETALAEYIASRTTTGETRTA